MIEPDLPTQWACFASGDSCLVLEFATVLSVAANRRAAWAARLLEQAWQAGRLRGVTDIVPGMVTVGVHYQQQAIALAGGDETPFQALERQIEEQLRKPPDDAPVPAQRIDIPVCYDGDFAPDLQQVAHACGLSSAELVARHTGHWLSVLMIGFAPGNPYIGLLDERLSPPRRDTPRTQVPRGSIGLANRQSVIYPVASPGGWHLIGRTPLTLFDAERQPPCLLRSGDEVRFVAIDAVTFERLAAQASP